MLEGFTYYSLKCPYFIVRELAFVAGENAPGPRVPYSRPHERKQTVQQEFADCLQWVSRSLRLGLLWPYTLRPGQILAQHQSRQHRALGPRLYLPAVFLHLGRRSRYFEASFVGGRTSTRSAGKEKDGKAAIPRLASWTGGPFTQLSLKSARKLPWPSVREHRLVLSVEGTMRTEGSRNSESFRATRL